MNKRESLNTQFEYRSRSFDIIGVSQDDHIVKAIAKSGCFYESELLEYTYWLKQFWNSGDKEVVAIDVGANIGNHSMFMRAFLADRLIAIEPNSAITPLLHRNLSTNIDQYTIYECAVGQFEGSGTIAIPDDPNNMGMAKVVSGGNGGDVKILTLDSIVRTWQESQNNPSAIYLIKIDVEGMELAVLRGAEEIIEKYRPHIFAEAMTREDAQKLNAHLRRFGYQKLGCWGATPVYHFAYKPKPSLVLRVRSAQLMKKMKKQKTRLKRRLQSLSLHAL